ncbi:MAG: hypothetical protein ACFFCS_28160, partial [Candidatus Hodarchaeota archaeon]
AFCIWTQGYQTSRTLEAWIDIANRTLDWAEANGHSNIVITVDMEHDIAWMDGLYDDGAPRTTDPAYDDQVMELHANLHQRCQSLGIEMWTCFTKSQIWDGVDGDHDICHYSWQPVNYDSWDKIQPQLYDSLDDIALELAHLQVEFGRERVQPCMCPKATLEELRTQVRLTRFYGHTGMIFWPGCRSYTPGLFCQYGYNGTGPSLKGLQAVMDEINKTIDELEPVTITTSVRPGETIEHYIDKLHGAQFYTEWDIAQDLAFNFGRNGMFIILFAILGLAGFFIFRKINTLKPNIILYGNHDDTRGER